METMKSVLSCAGIVVLWILYSLVLRPAFLIGEIFIVLFEFVLDLATFPIDYISEAKKRKERNQ